MCSVIFGGLEWSKTHQATDYLPIKIWNVDGKTFDLLGVDWGSCGTGSAARLVEIYGPLNGFVISLLDGHNRNAVALT
eukprot:scaffold26439_cov113-Cylindrotheca_fusiformis.AAC.1